MCPLCPVSRITPENNNEIGAERTTVHNLIELVCVETLNRKVGIDKKKRPKKAKKKFCCPSISI